MANLFAEWQPRYAERGIATFPVTADKRPAISNWQRVGHSASSQLAMKFSDADAFGFRCGRRSRITLIDIDSKDMAVVSEAVRLFGRSPILWRTGSGNYAMPFRHSGEARRIRPVPGLPIDVLGDGHAVLPPSLGARGRRYEIIQGGLADLDRLPAIRPWKEAEKAAEAKLNGYKRNNDLFHFALGQARHVDNLDALIDVVRTRNLEFDRPLGDDEIVRLATSAWKYEQEGRNLMGTGAAVVTEHRVIDRLKRYPHALALLDILKRHHWGREFVVANAMHETLGWSRGELVKARNKLIEMELIVVIKPKGRRTPAIFRHPDLRLTESGSNKK